MPRIPVVRRKSNPFCRLLPLLFVCLLAPKALAQDALSSIVDRCGSDVDAGGTNLVTALSTGRPVTFSCGGPATIRITRRHVVDTSVVIDGGGSVTLDGGGASAFLAAGRPGLSITLRGLTLRAMKPEGRASVVEGDQVTIADSRIRDSFMPVNALGVLTLDGVTFENNMGVVVAAKTAVITNSVFRGNKAVAVSIDGGAASIIDSLFEDNGESIFTRCAGVNILRSTYARNSSLVNALRPGGALRSDCPLDIVNGTFTDNVSTSGGGAIHLFAAGRRLTIAGSRFTGNRTERGGGALSVDWTSDAAPEITLKQTIFKANQAKTGGAVFIGAAGGAVPGPAARLTAVAVTFSGNGAEKGGAVAAENTQLVVNRGFFLRNIATSGGAVWMDPPATPASSIANALFVLNQAQDGTFVGRATTFTNATLLGSTGAGIVFSGPPADAAPADRAIRLANSIVENNSAGNCVGEPQNFVAKGANLQFPGTSCGAAVTVSPALLDAFYAPILGGAARGTGVDALCLGAVVGGIDAYGARRPQADHCSIGAVEGDMKRIVASLEKPNLTPPDPGKGHAGTAVEMSDSTGSGSGSGGSTQCSGSEEGVAPVSRQPSAVLSRLLAANVDFSVPMRDLESWLTTPDFTPYPALSEALLGQFAGKRLKCPVFLDVIVFKYESTHGVASPRRLSDVKQSVLRAAVVKGFNERYGSRETDFGALFE